MKAMPTTSDSIATQHASAIAPHSSQKRGQISKNLPVAPLIAAKISPKADHQSKFEQLELFDWKINDSFCTSHQIPSSKLNRRGGLICLNDMWRLTGEDPSRLPSCWIKQKQTQLLIKNLQQQITGHIYLIYRGRKGGTFAVDELAYKYWEYLNIKRNVKLTEKRVQQKLAKTLINAKLEVPNLAGKIDILTDTEIIEVKSVSSWKCAIGQVLIYGLSYPKHQKRIHLFGETSSELLSLIRSASAQFDIEVTWEN